MTQPECVTGILAHGLFSTALLVERFAVPEAVRAEILARPRPARVALHHPGHGTAVINDNSPLSEKALAGCLDDGLAPSEWLAMLNARVFFWPAEQEAATLAGARLNRGRRLAVLVVDTLGLVRAHAARVELCPINSGATIRKAARRGRGTFTPLAAAPRRPWPRLREVVVRDAAAPLAPHVVEVRHIGGSAG